MVDPPVPKPAVDLDKETREHAALRQWGEELRAQSKTAVVHAIALCETSRALIAEIQHDAHSRKPPHRRN
jgi:hypothetical protein